MKKKLLILPALLLLFGCNTANNGGGSGSNVPPVVIEETYYVLYMYNYPRMSSTAPSGSEEKVDNMLYLKEEITLGSKLVKPETDPERDRYLFEGWYKEKSCENAWDFANDVANSTLYLYAKWGVGQTEEYVEPEYIVPETIITDANYRITGIMNKPVVNNEVELTYGAIYRLEEHKDDVSFAINYERKRGVTLSSATYNVEEKKINAEASSGEKFEITVKDISLDKKLENSTYETKAFNYETNGVDIENHHIALVGSSSMENWSTSTEDMDPIVTFNHGIGGTTAEEWGDSLLERLVLPYSPKAVVYYVGVNDIINKKKSGAYTGEKIQILFDRTHQYLPNAHIFYVLINKLPSYEANQPDFDVTNQVALDYEASHDYLTCIDAGKGLLKTTGRPNAAYFISDGLHMSKYGYVIWGGAVKKAIMDWLG